MATHKPAVLFNGTCIGTLAGDIGSDIIAWDSS